jgi:hypothetical protein
LQLADASRGYGTAFDTAPKGQIRQDRDFVGGIESIHIGRGVCLGVSQFLGVFQNTLVSSAFIGHPREDVVRGAIDDSAHPVDPVPPQGLLERFNDRDATTNGGFDEHIHPSFGGGVSNFFAVTRDSPLCSR